ncbi:hypothetical protein [uncultured Duncaniella sp.]|uniref:hypothetical protein n=1 Tax=uncultured Duncaniella sp. TaxID=2768039 RepID=UPI0026EE110A|nr:hypothetical protein [uncultured Duncaniella sp.]
MKLRNIISAGLFVMALPVFGQTLDTKALSKFSPATQRAAFEVCKNVKLSSDQQVALAQAIEKENQFFVKAVNDNEGVLTIKNRNQLNRMREKTLKELLDENQLAQYYRGVYDAEADAEGNAIANALQKKYDLTDQNWKFIRVAFYKIALDSRVIRKMMADQPKKADKKIEELKKYYLGTIEKKGGLSVDPETMTIKWLKEFNPDTLHK